MISYIKIQSICQQAEVIDHKDTTGQRSVTGRRVLMGYFMCMERLQGPNMQRQKLRHEQCTYHKVPYCPSCRPLSNLYALDTLHSSYTRVEQWRVKSAVGN